MSKAFYLERLRTKWAEDSDYKKLINSYSSANPEIPNLNTGKKWDGMNNLKKMTFAINPMAYDRTKYVAKNIEIGKVLDIGSGPGNLENFLKDRSNEVVGIDISFKSVVKAKKMFPKYKFIVGDFLDLNIKLLGKFDYVTALEVMEHISPSRTFYFLKKVKKVLKPSGTFIISVPLNEGLEKMIARGENPNAHVRVYTPWIIRAELSISGFKIVKEKYLYAFSNNYYIKSFLAHLFPFNKHPNNVIIVSKKI